MDDRYFNKTLEFLKSTYQINVKIGALNILLNLAYKENDACSDEKARKLIVDLNLSDMLIEMKEKERDPEVRGYLERTIKKLS